MTSQIALSRVKPLALCLLLLVAVIAVVNPIREFMSQDDGWAYARSVQHLLATGAYRLDTWSAANMPVQIGLAGLASQVFGYSLTLLRATTLLLLAVGLTSFYFLLRQLHTGAAVAGALTLVLLANPFVAILSFTFMSDIQFLGWLVLALALYAHGFTHDRKVSLLLGSIAAGCAIGTRQFGIAIVGGLVVSFLVADPARRPRPAHLMIALAVPAAAAFWQLRTGLETPNFTQIVRLDAQAWFASQPLPSLMTEGLWRIGTLARYVGIGMLAALPVLLPLAIGGWRSGRGRRHVTPPWQRFAPWLMLAAVASLLICATGRRSAFSERDTADWFLPLWWMLPNAFWESRRSMAVLDLAGLVTALLLGAMACRMAAPHLARPRRPSFTPAFVAATGVCLLGLHLTYVQFNDTYVVAFLPFALLLPALALRAMPVARGWVTGTAIAATAIALALAWWMRADYNAQAAQWRAADRLMAQGLPARCIGASRHWSEYHGGFDAWLADGHPGFGVSPTRLGGESASFHDAFYLWMEQRSDRAVYRISSPWEPAHIAGWRTIAEEPYRDALLRLQVIRIAERPDLRHVDPSCLAPAAR